MKSFEGQYKSTLYCTLYFTGSQWRIFNTGVICSHFGVLVTTRFLTDFDYCCMKGRSERLHLDSVIKPLDVELTL